MRKPSRQADTSAASATQPRTMAPARWTLRCSQANELLAQAQRQARTPLAPLTRALGRARWPTWRPEAIKGRGTVRLQSVETSLTPPPLALEFDWHTLAILKQMEQSLQALRTHLRLTLWARQRPHQTISLDEHGELVGDMEPRPDELHQVGFPQCLDQRYRLPGDWPPGQRTPGLQARGLERFNGFDPQGRRATQHDPERILRMVRRRHQALLGFLGSGRLRDEDSGKHLAKLTKWIAQQQTALEQSVRRHDRPCWEHASEQGVFLTPWSLASSGLGDPNETLLDLEALVQMTHRLLAYLQALGCDQAQPPAWARPAKSSAWRVSHQAYRGLLECRYQLGVQAAFLQSLLVPAALCRFCHRPALLPGDDCADHRHTDPLLSKTAVQRWARLEQLKDPVWHQISQVDPRETRRTILRMPTMPEEFGPALQRGRCSLDDAGSALRWMQRTLQNSLGAQAANLGVAGTRCTAWIHQLEQILADEVYASQGFEPAPLQPPRVAPLLSQAAWDLPRADHHAGADRPCLGALLPNALRETPLHVPLLLRAIQRLATLARQPLPRTWRATALANALRALETATTHEQQQVRAHQVIALLLLDFLQPLLSAALLQRLQQQLEVLAQGLIAGSTPLQPAAFSVSRWLLLVLEGYPRTEVDWPRVASSKLTPADTPAWFKAMEPGLWLGADPSSGARARWARLLGLRRSAPLETTSDLPVVQDWAAVLRTLDRLGTVHAYHVYRFWQEVLPIQGLMRQALSQADPARSVLRLIERVNALHTELLFVWGASNTGVWMQEKLSALWNRHLADEAGQALHELHRNDRYTLHRRISERYTPPDARPWARVVGSHVSPYTWHRGPCELADMSPPCTDTRRAIDLVPPDAD